MQRPQKLWDKGIETDKLIESFTIGRDKELDVLLAPFDVLGSLAHITMLTKIGLIEPDELALLTQELRNIYREVEKGDFQIDAGIEDVHSQIELMLTQRLGDVGKKIHSARSRNDQVLVDLRLFTRAKLTTVVESVQLLFAALLKRSEEAKDVLIPGYTHLQIAMPSSFGLWFGAYAESLSDDLIQLLSCYNMVNQNPLGSAAGYGSSFPIDRQLTSDLLGFNNPNYNVVYAQMGRGKTERTVAFTLANLASTLSKFAYDACLFMSQNFGFIKLPDQFTTGSSIMPHKKNPDVFELVRAKCNKIQALPVEMGFIHNNLPSGYFRDYQVLKESYLEAFDYLNESLIVLTKMVEAIEVVNNIVDDDRYKYIFSVEQVNNEVLNGIPFRDAYKKVAASIEAGTFKPDRKVEHTHLGSIGNLANDKIKAKFESIIHQFGFEKVALAEEKLLDLK